MVASCPPWGFWAEVIALTTLLTVCPFAQIGESVDEGPHLGSGNSKSGGCAENNGISPDDIIGRGLRNVCGRFRMGLPSWDRFYHGLVRFLDLQ